MPVTGSTRPSRSIKIAHQSASPVTVYHSLMPDRPRVAIVQNLELRAVEDFFGQLELILEGRKQRVALDDALHEGQVQVRTQRQRLLIKLRAAANEDVAPGQGGIGGSIRPKSETVRAPGISPGERVSTIVVRFGSGLPMDSKVLRPITMTWPVVICLNHLKSSGRCHGMRLPAPMTRLSDMAAMALKGFTRQSAP